MGYKCNTLLKKGSSSYHPVPKKTASVSHIGPNTFRQIFFHISSKVIEEQEKIMFERSSTLTPLLAENKFKIYNGRSYTSATFNIYAVGFKFGEFT